MLSADRKVRQSNRLGRDSGWGVWDKMVREGLCEGVAFEQGRIGRACQAEGRARLEALRQEQAWYRNAVPESRAA